MAEYFRDAAGPGRAALHRQHLPLRRRPAPRCRRCSAACRAPSATSRPWPTEMGQLQERITSTKKGSITSVQAIYVPADDYTDPAPATTFAHLDATIVLVALDLREGHLPGRRPARLDLAHPPAAASSASEHYEVAHAVQQVLQRYKDLQDIIAILGMDELSDEDKRDRAARAQDRALPLAAVPRRRGLHRPPRQVRPARGHDPLASASCSTASTTTCPSRPSTWSARSRRRWRRRSS